jgi:ribosome biogenesis GTPase A
MSFWPVVKRVIKDADIVVEVLDARVPNESLNEEIERFVRKEEKVLVRAFTKIDLVSRERIIELRKKFPDCYLVSGVKNIGISKLKTGLLIIGKSLGKTEPIVGIVGYPNMGKSAIINALCKRGKTKVSRMAGTTKNIQWVKAGSLRILDSPGVVPMDDKEIRLGVIGSKNPEKLKNPERAVFEIIKLFMNNGKKHRLEEYYGIEIGYHENVDVILEKIAIAKKLLRKGGIIDEHRAIFMFLKDWQAGNLRF